MSDMRVATAKDLERVDVDTLEEILSEFTSIKHGNNSEAVMRMLMRYIASRGITISSDGEDEWYVCSVTCHAYNEITVDTRSEAYQVALEILVNRETE